MFDVYKSILQHEIIFARTFAILINDILQATVTLPHSKCAATFFRNADLSYNEYIWVLIEG